MRKRLLSLVLIIALCISLVPSTNVMAAQGNVYVVKEGDNLYRIGRQNNVSWQEIAKLNDIEEPYTIYVGQKLTLPLTEEEKQAEQEAASLEDSEGTEEDSVFWDEEYDGDYYDEDYSEDYYSDEYLDEDYSDEDYSESYDMQDALGVSDWTLNDITLAGYYGIYPDVWFEEDISYDLPISKIRVKELAKTLSEKIKAADGVLTNPVYRLDLKQEMTVEDVLHVLFTVIASKDYTKDLGLEEAVSAVEYMTANLIYTGENGEPALTDVCTMEAAVAYTTRVVTFVYNELDAASKGLLWEVNQGGNKVYLLGSVHIADNDIYPFSNELVDAYKSSDALVVELNIFNFEAILNGVSLMTYSDGTTLKDHVSDETYEKTVEFFQTQLGYAEENIAVLKPWVLSDLISMEVLAVDNNGTSSMDASLGIDMNFMVNATLDEKPILEIEGYEKQIEVFNNMSDGLQEYLLTSSIDSYYASINGLAETTQTDMLEQWLEYWKDGDVEGFKSTFSVDDEFTDITNGDVEDAEIAAYMEEYYDALLTKRDIGMANYINGLLQSEGNNTYFVIVGALHFTSDYSVLDILEDRGYEITQVK
ncbi:MAG: hypothetical protein K0R92_1080 [Lachnospiraceae bacterium]|jgi:uncharacterized protein YbaP (TraB family)/LysM repeat protein|nr:hypothetical protein [Lachnospiraceae bacterium]